MDFALTADQELFVTTTRRFLEAEAPVERVRDLAARGGGFDRDYWRSGAALGWTAALAPEELGGGSVSGDGLLDLVLVAEEMGRVVAPGPLLSVNVVVDALARSDGDHTGVLDGLLAGDSVAAWCLDEGAGSWDPSTVALEARPGGDGWILDGRKTFVLDAPSADWFLVVARTGDGLTQFLVPSAAEGVGVRARESLDLVRQVGDVELTKVGVPANAVVGAVGNADADVERQLLLAVVLQNAETVGAIDRVFEFTLAYANDRVAFGRPLASYQALKHRFADLKLALEACHATATASAKALAADQPDASEAVSIAKSFIAVEAPELVQDAVQLHGGIGVTWDHDLHLYLRRVTQNAFLFGGVRHHRERIAASIGM